VITALFLVFLLFVAVAFGVCWLIWGLPALVGRLRARRHENGDRGDTGTV
jgi:hypothetical protein